MFECLRCEYTTDRKNDIKKHYNRKITCNFTKLDIPITECLQQINWLNW